MLIEKLEHVPESHNPVALDHLWHVTLLRDQNQTPCTTCSLQQAHYELRDPKPQETFQTV